MRKIKIIQVLPTISYGDAVSNDAINIDKILKSKTDINKYFGGC